MKNWKSSLKYGLGTSLVTLTGLASAASTLVDYGSVVTTATAEVTGAIAAGVTFFGLIRGAKAGMAFIKSMLAGR